MISAPSPLRPAALVEKSKRSGWIHVSASFRYSGWSFSTRRVAKNTGGEMWHQHEANFSPGASSPSGGGKITTRTNETNQT